MKEKVGLFYEIGEPFVAGLFEDEERGDFFRFSKAIRRFYEARPVNLYNGGRLYPSGLDQRGNFAVQPDCAKTFNPATGGKGTLKGFYEPLKQKNEEAAEIMLKFREEHNFTVIPNSDVITISGYTHSIPYYERILKEGFNSYVKRIQKIKDADMRDGLMEVLIGLKNYHGRCLEYLCSVNADPDLIAALEKVPFQPAENIYQAIVGWNFIFYLDNTDNLGWIDGGLSPYYNGENVVPELRELFQNVVANDGWSCSIGPHYSDLTKQCLVAVKGLFRPMMELRVTPDMPDDIWKLAMETLYSCGGQPAFYNETMLEKDIAEIFPDAPDEDRIRFCGSGCTETTLAGMSNVGGIDGNINLALIFERYMKENLEIAESFNEFYNGYLKKVKEGVELLLGDVWYNHEQRAKHLPNPLRSLLIDNCIDKGLDYNNGGAKYNAALTSDSGMINVIDSLLAIRCLIYDQKKYKPKDFLELLEAEDPRLFNVLKKCPHYGVDDEESDKLITDFSTYFYGLYKSKKCYRGGRCIPTSHQFNRHTKEGKKVGPTPDGRRRGESLCDSIGALSGKSTNGPTAMLLSATKLDQASVYGIPVLNLTISKNFVKTSLKALLQAYMNLGGVQVQVTITSKEDLLDALVHPERHEDLVVRVGGYSEYFNRLTKDLKKVIVERTLHES
jgi:formate C-acetyltransferase